MTTATTFTTPEAVEIIADEFGLDADLIAARLVNRRPAHLGWTDVEIQAYGEALAADLEG